MGLKERLNQDLVTALKNHELLKIETFRLVSAAIHNQEIEKKSKSGESDLSEEEVLAVFKKEAKKRKEAHQIYDQAKRDDLARKEMAELEIIKSYLPPELDETAIKKVVAEIIKNSGVRGAESFSRVMGEAMKKLKNRADAALVSRIIKQELENQ